MVAPADTHERLYISRLLWDPPSLARMRSSHLAYPSLPLPVLETSFFLLQSLYLYSSCPVITSKSFLTRTVIALYPIIVANIKSRPMRHCRLCANRECTPSVPLHLCTISL